MAGLALNVAIVAPGTVLAEATLVPQTLQLCIFLARVTELALCAFLALAVLHPKAADIHLVHIVLVQEWAIV